MSQIIKTLPESGSTIIGHRCDGHYCTSTIPSEPENFDWLMYEGREYCTDCQEFDFAKCVRCKKMKLSEEVNRDYICKECQRDNKIKTQNLKVCPICCTKASCDETLVITIEPYIGNYCMHCFARWITLNVPKLLDIKEGDRK